jgi:hypothetical protein
LDHIENTISSTCAVNLTEGWKTSTIRKRWIDWIIQNIYYAVICGVAFYISEFCIIQSDSASTQTIRTINLIKVSFHWCNCRTNIWRINCVCILYYNSAICRAITFDICCRICKSIHNTISWWCT